MHRLALAVLAAAQFLVVLTTSIVNVALPAIDLGLSATGQAWVVNAYVLLFGALLLPGGRLGDVRGRRRMFSLGTGIFTAGLLAAGLANTPAVLIGGRAVQGVGAALLAPAALGLVLTLFPSGAGRAKALGLWGAVSGAGGAAGVLLGGLLTDALGWRSVFLAGVPLALAILVAARLLVPADTPAGGRIDVGGAVTVTAGLVALTYGLSAAGRSGWTSPVVLGSLGAGAALLAVFAVLQAKVPHPLVRPGLLRIGSVAPANVLMALLGTAWLGLFFFLPLYQQRVLGYSPILAGVTQLPMAGAITLASALTPRLVRLAGRRVPLTAAFGLLAAGLWWLSRTPVDGTFLTAIAVPSILVGVGLGVAFVLLTELSAAGVPAGDAGLAGGLVNTARQAGGAVGLAVLAAVAIPADSGASALAAGYGAALATAAVTMAVTAVLSPALVRARRRAP